MFSLADLSGPSFIQNISINRGLEEVDANLDG